MNELNNSDTPLKYFIEVYKNKIPSNICDDIINEIDDDNWQKHTWYDLNKNTFLSEQSNELDVMGASPQIYKKIHYYFENCVKQYNQKFSFESEKTKFIVNKISSIRLNRYSITQCMRQHHDHIHALFDGDEKGIPVISIIANLNDDYDGGQLYFWSDFTLNLSKGDIIIFPSNFMYPHGVKEVVSGKRYSAVAWSW